jgi:hypothetical protein
MHEMVTEWTRPADEGIIVAGLVPFATLSALADIMKLELGLGTVFHWPRQPLRLPQ